MAEIVAFRGVVVGSQARPYGSFKSEQGETVEGGVSRQVWVSRTLDEPPTVVKVPQRLEADFAGLLEAGVAGSIVELSVTLHAEGNRLTRRLEGWSVVATRDGEVVAAGASANGKR